MFDSHFSVAALLVQGGTVVLSLSPSAGTLRLEWCTRVRGSPPALPGHDPHRLPARDLSFASVPLPRGVFVHVCERGSW